MEIFPLRQPLNRQDLAAIRLDCQNRAGFYRRAVKHDRAGTADAGLTANMAAGKTHHISQIMDQKEAGFHLVGVMDAIDPD